MRLLRLLQLADAAFPTGGFAHSQGAEAAWRLGMLGSPQAMRDHCADSLHHAAHSSVPVVMAARRAPGRFAELDQLADSMLANHVARRASSAQGQAWLMAASSAFADEALHSLRRRARSEGLPCHLAPVFGLVAGVLGISAAASARTFLHLHLRGLIGALVRLGALGPLHAQAMQAELTTEAEHLARQGARLRLRDAAATAPLHELWQAHHDRIYSRLFAS